MTKFNAAFWKWFGDSKVVDSDGKPLRVYHGTPKGDFSQFGSGKPGAHGAVFGYGYYFTDDPNRSEAYAMSGTGANIIPVFLSIKNPFILERILTEAQAEKLGKVLADVADAQGEDKSLLLSVRDKREFADAKEGYVFYMEKVKEWEEIGGGYDRVRPMVKKYGGKFYVYYNDASMLTVDRNAAEAFRVIMSLHGPDVSTILQRAGFDGVKNWDEWVAYDPRQIKSATGNDGTWDADDPSITSNPPPKSYSHGSVAQILRETDGTGDPDWVDGLISQVKPYPKWVLAYVDPKDLNSYSSDTKTIKEYAAMGMSSAPPIVIIPSETGPKKYDVLDGSHRVAAAEMLRQKVLSFVPESGRRKK